MLNEKFYDLPSSVRQLAELCLANDRIDPALYAKHNVKRGLRDLQGKGVLTGLTEISEIISHKVIDDQEVPCQGELYYRGYDIKKLTEDFLKGNRFGFEETTYLLLFGNLPNQKQLDEFKTIIGEYRTLPVNFVNDIILKAPSVDMMNTLARSVLTLYSYDKLANDISVPNVLRQCLQLIALFPVISVYGYQAYSHYHQGKSLFIHKPLENLSTAENILHLLRPDGKYTHLEAQILDLALVLQAEHGGGNNSTFTTHVVTSSGTDTYSAIAAALGSLKGPRHGGANIKVVQMIEHMKENLSDWSDDEEISAYLEKILDGEAFDHSGLLYGMGHAIYSLSDPRADIFKHFVKLLSEEKGNQKEFGLYSRIEELAPKVITNKRKIYKGVSANVDFYSGFVYQMLDLPMELYTPIFAIARIAGWSAHRLEEIINVGKIIRPAYMAIAPQREFVSMKDRDSI